MPTSQRHTGTRLWILFSIQDQNLQVLNSIFNLHYLELPINRRIRMTRWGTTTILWGFLVSLSTLESQENGGSPASLCSQEKDYQCKVKANTLAPIKILPLTMMAKFFYCPPPHLKECHNSWFPGPWISLSYGQLLYECSFLCNLDTDRF